MTTHTITQTVGKAAAKTFLQAFLGVLSLALVPHLLGMGDAVVKGEAVVLETDFYRNVLIAAGAAGIAALISAAWNWSKSATPAQPGNGG